MFWIIIVMSWHILNFWLGSLFILCLEQHIDCESIKWLFLMSFFSPVPVFCLWRILTNRQKARRKSSK